jgi:hypothetical protein
MLSRLLSVSAVEHHDDPIGTLQLWPQARKLDHVSSELARQIQRLAFDAICWTD